MRSLEEDEAFVGILVFFFVFLVFFVGNNLNFVDSLLFVNWVCLLQPGRSFIPKLSRFYDHLFCVLFCFFVFFFCYFWNSLQQSLSKVLTKYRFLFNVLILFLVVRYFRALTSSFPVIGI